MFLRLRILFTILSAIFIAALFPVGTFFGWGWAGACGLIALLFFGFMLLCKQSQENNQPSPDEINNPDTTENPEKDNSADTNSN